MIGKVLAIFSDAATIFNPVALAGVQLALAGVLLGGAPDTSGPGSIMLTTYQQWLAQNSRAGAGKCLLFCRPLCPAAPSVSCRRHVHVYLLVSCAR